MECAPCCISSFRSMLSYPIAGCGNGEGRFEVTLTVSNGLPRIKVLPLREYVIKCAQYVCCIVPSEDGEGMALSSFFHLNNWVGTLGSSNGSIGLLSRRREMREGMTLSYTRQLLEGLTNSGLESSC
jgi:hypothetical protein